MNPPRTKWIDARRASRTRARMERALRSGAAPWDPGAPDADRLRHLREAEREALAPDLYTSADVAAAVEWAGRCGLAPLVWSAGDATEHEWAEVTRHRAARRLDRWLEDCVETAMLHLRRVEASHPDGPRRRAESAVVLRMIRAELRAAARIRTCGEALWWIAVRETGAVATVAAALVSEQMIPVLDRARDIDDETLERWRDRLRIAAARPGDNGIPLPPRPEPPRPRKTP